MASDMDSQYLQSRIRELEHELETLRANYELLKKDKDDIFCKWTKTDFLGLLDDFLLENKHYKFSEDAKEKLWILWKPYYVKKFDASGHCEEIKMLLEDLIDEQKQEFILAPYEAK